MRIGKKTIHSVIIGLAMALPILYLGGSMIAGLAGAHGDQLWASDNEAVQNILIDDFSRYTWIDVNNGDIRYDSSIVNQTSPRYYVYDGYESLSFEFNVLPNYKRVCYYSDTSYVGYVNFESISGTVLIPQGVNYFHICGSSDVSLTCDVTITYPNGSVSLSAVNYGDYLFNNFFPKSNFVERIGQNALSESPKGFAPFGTMLRYLDLNVFHAGDSQTALMVYGMVYWSLHVIIADLVYHVLVFVPNLINKVFDWFGQRGLDDD